MQPGLPKPDGTRQGAGTSYGNSFTLPLFATRSEVLGGFSPPARLIRCIGIRNNPSESQICHAICRDWKANQPHNNRHPQPVHKARLIIRRMSCRGKQNLHSGRARGIESRRRQESQRTTRLRGPLPNWKRPTTEWPSRASQISSLAGVNLKPGVHLLWMHSFPDRVLNSAFPPLAMERAFNSRTQYRLQRNESNSDAKCLIWRYPRQMPLPGSPEEHRLPKNRRVWTGILQISGDAV
jgi:hypothetical protein